MSRTKPLQVGRATAYAVRSVLDLSAPARKAIQHGRPKGAKKTEIDLALEAYDRGYLRGVEMALSVAKELANHSEHERASVIRAVAGDVTGKKVPR